jgi:ABC-type multidrug transport system ATPase subunit
MEGDVLRVDGLTRHFRDRAVVSGLSFDVSGGERVALTGPNGSGKTTVLRCIAGTLTPTTGSIWIDGAPAASIEARRRRGISLSQERSFYLRLTGRENLAFYARVRGEGPRPAVAVTEVVDELELGTFIDQRADEYSSGMLQQLAFARALLGSPVLLLLDEPTRSLDAEATGRLWGAIERRPHVAVLIATHSSDEVGRCNSRIVLDGA